MEKKICPSCGRANLGSAVSCYFCETRFAAAVPAGENLLTFYELTQEERAALAVNTVKTEPKPKPAKKPAKPKPSPIKDFVIMEKKICPSCGRANLGSAVSCYFCETRFAAAVPAGKTLLTFYDLTEEETAAAVGAVKPPEPKEVPAKESAKPKPSPIEDFVIEDGVLKKYDGRGGNVVIPEGVTSIGEEAFRECRFLTSVIIPEGVTSIGTSAFQWCNTLTSVTIPDSVTSIGYGAFWSCRSLKNVAIPDSVTSIGPTAFSWCESLTSVDIPDGVEKIGEYVFYKCVSLTDVIIPKSVTRIGIRAFSHCESLTDITIPDSVTYIGADAFLGCESLTVKCGKVSFVRKYCKRNNISYTTTG